MGYIVTLTVLSVTKMGDGPCDGVIGIISKQLGHASIATTARYLDHIAPQQVIETMRLRTWQL